MPEEIQQHLNTLYGLVFTLFAMVLLLGGLVFWLSTKIL